MELLLGKEMSWASQYDIEDWGYEIMRVSRGKEWFRSKKEGSIVKSGAGYGSDVEGDERGKYNSGSLPPARVSTGRTGTVAPFIKT